jgi:hypothetical protein
MKTAFERLCIANFIVSHQADIVLRLNGAQSESAPTVSECLNVNLPKLLLQEFKLLNNCQIQDWRCITHYGHSVNHPLVLQHRSDARLAVEPVTDQIHTYQPTGLTQLKLWNRFDV